MSSKREKMSMETKIVHKEVRKKAFQNINKIPSHSVFKNYGTGAVEQKQGISTLRELVFCENISFWSKNRLDETKENNHKI